MLGLQRGGLAHRPLAIAFGALLGGALGAAPPSMGRGEGLLYDLETAAVARLLGAPLESGAAVVALDAASLKDPRFAALPRALMAPLHAKLVDAALGAGAAALGFDFIFAWSGNTLSAANGAATPNYDWSFLDALSRRRERVVLAQSDTMAVAPPYHAVMRAFLDKWALGFIEKFPDPDEIYRHVPLMLEMTDGSWVPTLAGSLLARIGQAPAERTVLLAPRRSVEDLPTYSYADILRCAESDPAKLKGLLSGKVLVVGTTLPDEDRLVAGTRFLAPPPARVVSPACPPQRLGASASGARTVAGVYLHAAAVDAVLHGALARPAPMAARGLVGALAGALAGFLGFRLRPWMTLTACLGLAALAAGGAALGLSQGVWLPAAPILIALAGAAILSYVARFLLEERQRRRVQDAFGHFLSPIVIDRILADESALRLGGEIREISVFFADLSGFTALSGRVKPEILMAVTNRYLGLVAEEVEKTGGYIDKYIGDAVMAIWGAPALDTAHALHATEGALAACASVEAARLEDEAKGAPGYSVKIGVNTGPAVVGNVGAARRYNYTAVGETVNIAARLESVPSDYGCRIVLGPHTAEAAAEAFLLCELDWLRVKGKVDAIAVYEVVCRREDVTESDRLYVAGYGEALTCYRNGRFREASTIWRRLAHPRPIRGVLPPPAVMAARAEALAQTPPLDWDGVWTKTTK